MEITLRSNLARRAAIALEFAIFLAAVAWISKTYVAEFIGEKSTVQNLELALKFDPNNSDYHLRLGRLFQYSLMDINPERALHHLRRATELTPLSAQPWLDLAAALEFQGRTAEAESCLRRADSLAPNIPPLQWAIGNFFLLHGNVDEAFRHFRVVLAGTSQYNQILFSIAWKASGDADKVLSELIPRHIPTEFSYLYYLIAHQQFEDARSVWSRIMAHPEVFDPKQAGGYIDSLIGAHRPGEAYRIWSDLVRKGLIPGIYAPSEVNLIINGDFESEPLGMGFDWRINSVEGIQVVRDHITFHSPSRSLQIHFEGRQNIDYGHVYQYVNVTPNQAYHLQGFLKAENVSTDSGPRLEVRDAYDPAVLRELSEDLTGSTVGWTPVTLDFKTGPTTELISVRVARLPSRKLDNLITGKVWLDDLTLVMLPSESVRSR